MSFLPVLMVAVGGAAGALARHALATALRSAVGPGPWPIAVVNVLGCFAFGLCLALGRGRLPPAAEAGLLVGFLGAFTTFSTFAADALQLWTARCYGAFVSQLLLQNVLGVAAIAGGLALGAWLRR